MSFPSPVSSSAAVEAPAAATLDSESVDSPSLRHGLAIRFALIAAVLAGMAVFAVGLATWAWIRHQILEQAEAAVYQEISRDAERVALTLQAVTGTLGSLAANPLFGNSLTDAASRETSLFPFLHGLKQINGIAVEIVVLDQGGEMLANNAALPVQPGREQELIRQALDSGLRRAEILNRGSGAEQNGGGVGDLLVGVEPLIPHYGKVSAPTQGVLLYRISLETLRRLTSPALRWGLASLPTEKTQAAQKMLLAPVVLSAETGLHMLGFHIAATAMPVSLLASTERFIAGFAAASAVVMLLVLGLSLLSGYRLVRGLRHLERLANRVVREGLSTQRARVQGEDEVASLARSINVMLDRLADASGELSQQARAEIAGERDRFELAVRASSDGIWDWDLGHGRIWFSPRFKEMLGYSEAELADDLAVWDQILEAEHRASFLAALQESHRQSHGTTSALVPFRHKDGSVRYILARTIARRDGEGRLLRIVGAHSDVTEIQRTEQELRHAQSRLVAAQRIARLGNWEWDLQHNHLWCSPQIRELLGLEAEVELTSQILFAHVHSHDRERVVQTVRTAIREGTAFNIDHRVVRKDGRTSNVIHQGEVETDAQGRSIRLIGTLQDISDRKRLELMLSENLVFQRTLMDTIPNPIFYCSSDGRYLGCNTAFEDWFHLSRNALFGRAVHDIMPVELAGIHAQVDQDLVEHPGSQVYEALILTPDGKERQTLIAKATYLNDSGRVRGIVGAIVDITERKLTEDALRRSQEALSLQATELRRSNEELAQFAYVASHDLREPLRMVSNYLALLQRRYGAALDDKAKEFIGFAVDGAKRMDRLIADLLEYSRVGRKGGPLVATSLGEAIALALENLQVAIEESHARIVVEPPVEATDSGWPMLVGDLNELTRLFQNLVGNAIKYRSLERIPEVAITLEIAGDRAIITVRDNGIGIAPEHFERIFMIFQRLHPRGTYEGTGIGLAVCKKIVERHGGTLWVESQPEQGSAFRLSLPVGGQENAPRDERTSA